MNIIGEILLYSGVVSVWVGYVAVAFCAFTVSFFDGLISLVVPFMALRTAIDRFPRLLWFWGGGIALIVIGALMS